MADVLKQAHSTISVINNGSMVVFAQETGKYESSTPTVNSHVPSGQMEIQYNNRFDDVRYYTGDTAS